MNRPLSKKELLDYLSSCDTNEGYASDDEITNLSCRRKRLNERERSRPKETKTTDSSSPVEDTCENILQEDCSIKHVIIFDDYVPVDLAA